MIGLQWKEEGRRKKKEERRKMKEVKKEIVILVPYPAQGHVTPMQNLGWAFAAQGFHPLIVLPRSIHRQLHGEEEEEMRWVGLGDGVGQEESPDFFAMESAMEKSMGRELEGLIEKVRGEGDEVACVVVDLLASCAIEAAHRCGIPTAGFWPAMFATYLFIASIPLLLHRRLLSHTGLSFTFLLLSSINNAIPNTFFFSVTPSNFMFTREITIFYNI